MDGYLKFILLAFVLLFLLYKLGTKNYDFWKKKGVKQLKPVPFLGDDYYTTFRLLDALSSMIAFYEPFRGCRFGGLYIGQTPFLSITDPELVKQILVKNSEHFINRHEFIGGSDTLFSKNLFNLKDEKWKKMRTVMTTVFTSAKMKEMFKLMKKSAEQTVQHLESKTKQYILNNPGAKFLEIDQKDLYSRYGTDVIATTAYGLEVNSFENPNNEFYKSGFAIRNAMTGLNFIKVMMIFLFPKLAKVLKLTLLGEKYNKYFTSVISDTIKAREEKNIVRNDVIHTLTEARKGKGVDESGELLKGKLPDLTDEDIAAQTFLFFFGGFDTIASLLSFATYELAVNPDIQKEMQKQIDEVMEKDKEFTFEGIMNRMPYLNMILNETLRKWPPALMTDRCVSKTYVIPKTDQSPELILNKGDSIVVSIAGFHYDPKFFPNPEKFDPERFRNEKNTITPFTFLPFGEGIRHCIAKRYALMEAKIILVHMLRNFTFVPSKKTQIPMKLSKKIAFTLVPENGFWVGIEPRH